MSETDGHRMTANSVLYA